MAVTLASKAGTITNSGATRNNKKPHLYVVGLTTRFKSRTYLQ
nr:MAG TPA: hypothetical protein [Caudoviricetes sp.]